MNHDDFSADRCVVAVAVTVTEKATEAVDRLTTLHLGCVRWVLRNDQKNRRKKQPQLRSPAPEPVSESLLRRHPFARQRSAGVGRSLRNTLKRHPMLSLILPRFFLDFESRDDSKSFRLFSIR